MAKKVLKSKKKIDSIELLAQLMLEKFEEIDVRFDKVDERFDRIEQNAQKFRAEMNSRFDIVDNQLYKLETRIAALEFAVFGADAGKRKHVATTWFSRIERLEKAVFKK